MCVIIIKVHSGRPKIIKFILELFKREGGLSLSRCTQTDKYQNNTICVLTLSKCTQADNGKKQTMCVLSLFKCTQANNGKNKKMCLLSL